MNHRVVNEWVAKFYAQGLEGLVEKRRAGRPALLTNEQLLQFKKYVLDNSIKARSG